MSVKFLAIPQDKLFVLANIKFWADRKAELDLWCTSNNCRRTGMVVKAYTDHAYTMFVLKWS